MFLIRSDYDDFSSIYEDDGDDDVQFHYTPPPKHGVTKPQGGLRNHGGHGHGGQGPGHDHSHGHVNTDGFIRDKFPKFPSYVSQTL